MTFFSMASVQKSWRSWLQLAVWAAAVVATFIAPPPILTLTAGDGVDSLKFAQYIFALLVAIYLRRLDKRATNKNLESRARWATGGVVATTVLFFVYMY